MVLYVRPFGSGPSDYYYLRVVRTLFKHINGLATNHIVKFILYILPNY